MSMRPGLSVGAPPPSPATDKSRQDDSAAPARLSAKAELRRQRASMMFWAALSS